MITEQNGITTISKDQQTASGIETVKPQLNSEQQAKDLQTLQQPQKTPELPEERYASVLSSFTRMFARKVDMIAAKRGEMQEAKRLVELSRVEEKARAMDNLKLEQFDDSQSYQMNFNTIQDAEDIGAEMAHMNEINKKAIDTQRREVVTDEVMKGLANDLNADPQSIRKVMGLKPGEIVPPEYVLTMRQTLDQSAKRLKNYAQLIKSGEATDIDKVNFHKQWEFHSQYTQQFMGVRAEYGRGLRAFGINAGDESVPMNELMDRLSAGNLDSNIMAEQILLAGDTKSLNNVVKAQKGKIGKTVDMLFETFMSSILSGPQTHFVNVFSAAVKGVLTPLDTLVASAMKVDNPQIGSREAIVQLQGMMEANWEALQVAWKVGKSGEAYGGTSKIDVEYMKAISANALGIKEGTTANYVDKAGKFIRFSTDNLMGAEDAFFKVLQERGKLRQLAHRDALNKNLVGQEYNDHVAYLMSNPTTDMLKEARDAGTYGTFQQSLGETGRSVQTFRNSTPGARWVLPFVKTPINIIYEGFMERTPLAMITKKYTEALRRGGAEAQMAKAKMAVGTAFNSALIGIAMSGKVTGGYPQDAKLRQAMRDAGVQEYSFVVKDDNGKDKYISFNRLEPFNTVLALYANIAQTIHFANTDGANPEAEKEMKKLAAGMAVALTEATVNKTFMQGVSQLLNVVNNPMYSESYVMNFVNGLVPQSAAMRTLTRTIDPVVRDAQTILDKISKNIPGLSESKYPKRDNFGKPLEYENVWLPSFAKPLQDIETDDVRKEIFRLAETTHNVSVYKPKKTIGGYVMTAEEYDYYITRATITKRDGKNLYGIIKRTMASSEYKLANDYIKNTVLENIRNAYYDAAKAELMVKYPHIRKYGMDKKQYVRKLLGGK